MKVIERIKTLLFIGLFISSVILAGIYIVGLSRREASAGSDLPADVLSALRGGGGTSSATLQSEQLLPEFFGIKQSGAEAVGLMSGAAMMRDLDEQFAPWVAFALGEGAVCEMLTDDGDAYWQTCMQADAYFYLRWNFAVSAAVLRAHSLPGTADAMLDTASGTLPRIREIFFFPDLQDSDVCAVSRDGEGKVTLWRRTPGTSDVLPEFADFSIYLLGGILQEYHFAGNLDESCPSLLLTLPVPDNAISMPDLMLTRPFAETTGTARVPEALLTLFDYNLNKSGGYYEADTDTAVFVETHGTLHATAEAVVYEAAEQGGLSVADIVRKSSSAVNLRDDIIACETLIDRLRELDDTLIGGSAEPQLTAMRTEGDALILEYAYFYDNVRIGEETALRFVVRAHKIVTVVLDICRYRVGESNSRAGGQKWMLNLVDYLRTRDTLSAENYRVDLCYTASQSDAALLRVDWKLYVLD